jgi:hypothetical protein
MMGRALRHQRRVTLSSGSLGSGRRDDRILRRTDRGEPSRFDIMILGSRDCASIIPNRANQKMTTHRMSSPNKPEPAHANVVGRCASTEPKAAAKL